MRRGKAKQGKNRTIERDQVKPETETKQVKEKDQEDSAWTIIRVDVLRGLRRTTATKRGLNKALASERVQSMFPRYRRVFLLRHFSGKKPSSSISRTTEAWMNLEAAARFAVSSRRRWLQKKKRAKKQGKKKRFIRCNQNHPSIHMMQPPLYVTLDHAHSPLVYNTSCPARGSKIARSVRGSTS